MGCLQCGSQSVGEKCSLRGVVFPTNLEESKIKTIANHEYYVVNESSSDMILSLACSSFHVFPKSLHPLTRYKVE